MASPLEQLGLGGGAAGMVARAIGASALPLKSVTATVPQANFTGATIALRKLQLVAAAAGKIYVPIFAVLAVKVTVAFTNNPTNIVLSSMADPATGSEGDWTVGTAGIRGDGASGSTGRTVPYTLITNTIAAGPQIGIDQFNQPLWFVPRNQLTGAGTLTASIKVLYLELTTL
jgi:hypothetical protein